MAIKIILRWASAWAFISLAASSTLAQTNAQSELFNVIDPSAEVVARVGDMDFRHCNVTAQERDRKVQCAWFPVAENPAKPEAKQLDLFVVRLPARKKHLVQADAVLMLAGGPGQAASESYLFADQTWYDLASERDIYLIDQRGTGRSHYFGCEGVEGFDELMNSAFDSARISALAKTCLEQFDGDAAQYTTANTIADFEQVRNALKLTQWNLLGVSYGTRVATQYMQSFPDSVRTVVLDSVVPPQQALGPEIAWRSQQSLDALMQRCQASEQCQAQMPALADEVQGLFTKLATKPVTAQVENLTTGVIASESFTELQLTTLVRMYLYNTKTAALLPPMLHNAYHNNNFAPLVRAVMQVQKSLGHMLAMGLHNTVVCTEDYPYFDLSDDLLANTQKTYLGTTIIDTINAICQVWPKGQEPASGRSPLLSAIPTLITSGEFDPITPPAYGELTANTLSNAWHWVVPGQGHFVSATGCMPKLIQLFVERKSAQDLDSACLKRADTPPIFLNFNGPAP